MTPEAIQQAAALLAELRLRENGRDAPIEDLPEAIRPSTLDQAYAIQDALREGLVAGLGPAVGWKVGCTTPVMQEYLSIPHPCGGTLYERSVHHGGAEIRAADYFQLGLECEIAVQLGEDLPGRAGGHAPETVGPAVESFMASIEIVEHRFRDFSQAATESLVADDFFSAGCALGAPVPAAEIGDPAALEGGFQVNGAAPEATGRGEAILGHPLAALAWLADHRAARGSALRRGEVVTLGSVVKTIYPSAGETVEACFSRLPPVVVRVA